MRRRYYLMKIDKIEERITSFWNSLAVGKTINEVFSIRHTQKICGGFVEPTYCLLDTIKWIWLKWHQDQDMNTVRSVAQFVIARTLDVLSDPDVQRDSMGDRHDSFLVQLAVLTGCKVLMKTAAEAVEEAGDKSEEYQFYQAWTGILKYRILGDESKVRHQYEIYQRYKPLRAFLFPTKRMMQSFVEKDYKALNKVIRQRCEEHWKWSGKMGALEEKEDGIIVLHIDKYDPNSLWPWVEGTFAKLAYMDGAEITYDSSWLPLEFVKAIED